MEQKKITIGIFGAELFNSNMGCLALTYSLVSILSQARIRNVDFYFFVRNRHGDKEEFCRLMGISSRQVRVVSCMNLSKRDLFFRDVYFKGCIARCDLVIDLTQGDSFTDIYGAERFDMWTCEKEWVIKHHIPLILGPQTYGPFENQKNKMRAENVIKMSSKVFARDLLSYEFVKQMGCTNATLTCDLAFALPYNNKHTKDKIKKRIGVNISGLLWSDSAENTSKNFTLGVDYRVYILGLLDYLKALPNTEVTLVSHVSADSIASNEIIEQYPEFIAVEEFSNPIEAKSYISSCDLFIGARMHATIAAISTGVPVIPTAYSRKFTGLFNTLEYPYTVDLNACTTLEALKMTTQYIEAVEEMKKVIPRSLEVAKDLLSVFEESIQELILTL